MCVISSKPRSLTNPMDTQVNVKSYTIYGNLKYGEKHFDKLLVICQCLYATKVLSYSKVIALLKYINKRLLY